MGDALLVEDRNRALELLAALDCERQMVQSDPVFIEAVIAGGAGRVRRSVNADNRAPTAEEHCARDLHGDLKPENLSVEPAGPVDVGHSETDVVDATGRQRNPHGAMPLSESSVDAS